METTEVTEKNKKPVKAKSAPIKDSGENSNYKQSKDTRDHRRRPQRRARPKAEFEQKIIDIRRVTRVIAGGRRFSFSVVVVAGDRNGRVGVGIGKAGDTSLAIGKAFNDAKKNMIKLKLTKSNSLPNESSAKFCAAQIYFRPAPRRGLVAGSSIRTVLDLAGVKDINAKVISRSKNKLNNARATIEALREFVI